MKRYAETYWTIEDIHFHRDLMELSVWTDEQAENWLKDKEEKLKMFVVQYEVELLEEILTK